jgi:hypothetical protein
MTDRRRKGRRGYSLVEIVLVIGGVTIVLGMCGVLTHALLRLDKGGRAWLADASTDARLARQFRKDARSATASAPAGDDGISLTSPGPREVVYTYGAGRLTRTESSAGEVRSRESYVVGRKGGARFQVEDGFARLTLGRTSGGAEGLARPALVVEARLGKDRSETSEKEPSR